MTDLKQAAQQALEALVTCCAEEWRTLNNFGMRQVYDEKKVNTAIAALHAALLIDVTPAQMAHADALRRENEWLKDDLHDAARAFLAAERKPLTDEEIRGLADKHLFYQPEGYEVSGIFNFARAIERAHGIGEQT